MPRRIKTSDGELERLLVYSAPQQTDLTAVKLVNLVSFEDFERPDCRALWAAIEAVVAERDGWVNLAMVLKKAEIDQSQWQTFGSGLTWVMGGEAVGLGERVKDMAGRRRLAREGVKIVERTGAGDDVDRIVEDARDGLEGIHSVVPDRAPPPTLADVMAKDDRYEYDWLVPGWLEAKDRVMLTGGEGFGKMTMFRQWAVQMAAGFHPWDGTDYPPLRVLALDLQDGEQRNDREFRMIANMAGVEPFKHLFIETRRQGLNIIKRTADRRWVEATVRSCGPHVILIGPMYKLALGSDRKESETAQAICDFVDLLVDRYDVAVFLEGHSPNAPATGARTLRPYGGQEFTAWPDAGYGLAADGEHGAKLKSFRGNRDRLRKFWPERVVFGAEWPWVPRGAPSSVTALRPRHITRGASGDEGGDEGDRGAPEQTRLGDTGYEEAF